MSESVIDRVSNYIDDLKDVVKERFLSPMYFYFIVAWIITNWRFTYVLFFADEALLGKPKEKYLGDLYSVSHWSGYIWNIAELFIFPAGAAFIAIWWFSILGEKFYEKYEQHKINNRFIKNSLEYAEKVKYAKEQRKIRDAESDKNEIKYENNTSFNNWYDREKENIQVGEYEFLPSESLYNLDYNAYKEELEKYESMMNTPF